MASQQPIQFYHRGTLHRATDALPTRTVLQWLREDAGCVGTKEGCNEGDCGACTVVIGELNDDRLSLKAVNSCIQPLPSLNGKALITVEDLKRDGALHPCQQAMVACHGSQCGFCTPGFIMSLFAHYQRADLGESVAALTSREAIDTALSGNLCRCTGYRPIIDAAQQMFALPRVAFDAQPIIAALKSIDVQATLDYEVAGRRFIAPRSRAEFAALRVAHPDARIVAGNTDIGIWVNKLMRELPTLLYVGNVRDLKHCARVDNELRIGSAVSLEDAFAAITKHALPNHRNWQRLWQRFASPLIRNAGTLAGNIANGSPIGDAMPALIALNARVVLQRGSSLRALPLEALYLDYQKTAMAAGEFVAEVIVPIPAAQNWHFRCEKISKRFDQDISAVAMGLSVSLADGRVHDCRLAFGGMAAIPKRATNAEASLRGAAWSEQSVHRAMAALADDFKPLSDMRASAAYRMQVAQNLLMRAFLEIHAKPGDAPLTIDAFQTDAQHIVRDYGRTI